MPPDAFPTTSDSLYVIRLNTPDPEDGYLYWSDDDGWGFLTTASQYTSTARLLPLDPCEWVSL